MKSYRQSAILELVDREAITSQELLRERLKLRGIEATQATLSRDMRDLGLIKRAADGAYRRAGADSRPAGDPEGECRTAVDDYLRRYDVVDQLDIATMEQRTAPDGLALNAIGRVRIRLADDVAIDDYRALRRTGAFLLIDDADGSTIAAGMADAFDPPYPRTRPWLVGRPR